MSFLLISQIHHYLETFEGDPYIRAMQNVPWFPIALAIVYLAFVVLVPRYVMANREAVPYVRAVIAVWNLLFSIFSLVGFLYSAPVLYTLLTSQYLPNLAPKFDAATQVYVENPKVPGGLYTSLCYWNANIFQHGVAAFWLLVFDLSKLPEMMDSVFLVLQKKPVVFLHWYHHITVMLFCWHAHVTYISNGLWFAIMNMGVHAIMYLYYFMCACGQRKVVRPLAPLITCLQILQMAAGLVLVLYTGYLYATHPSSCDTNLTSIRFGMVMYATYFLLFGKFFYERYVLVGRRTVKRIQRDATPVPSISSLAAAAAATRAATVAAAPTKSAIHVAAASSCIRHCAEDACTLPNIVTISSTSRTSSTGSCDHSCGVFTGSTPATSSTTVRATVTTTSPDSVVLVGENCE